jgi:hypothetical protein
MTLTTLKQTFEIFLDLTYWPVLISRYYNYFLTKDYNIMAMGLPPTLSNSSSFLVFGTLWHRYNM